MPRLSKKRLHKIFSKQKRANSLAQPGCHECVVVCDHLKPDYNVGKIFRSADAFGAAEIHLIGIDFFNPFPACGSFRHVPARFYDDFSESRTALTKRGYSIYLLSADSEVLISETALPQRSAFVVGHEEFGFSFAAGDYPELQSAAIPQFGKVHSLNVSNAATIALYEYIRQHSASYLKPNQLSRAAVACPNPLSDTDADI